MQHHLEMPPTQGEFDRLTTEIQGIRLQISSLEACLQTKQRRVNQMLRDFAAKAHPGVKEISLSLID